MERSVDRAVLVLAAAAAGFASTCGGDTPNAPPPSNSSPCGYAGQTFKAEDGCNTCFCEHAAESGFVVSCTARSCLPDAGAGSLGQDASLPDRQAVPVDLDAGVCALPTTLTSYYDGQHAPATPFAGGQDFYRCVNKLDASGTLTITCTWIDGQVTSCALAPPPCGTAGVVTAATIAADLAEIDVRAAFAASPMSIYGVDDRLTGGAVYAIARDDGRILYVGSTCTSTTSNPCQPIPGGVQRLTDDLKRLTAQARTDPACRGL